MNNDNELIATISIAGLLAIKPDSWTFDDFFHYELPFIEYVAYYVELQKYPVVRYSLSFQVLHAHD